MEGSVQEARLAAGLQPPSLMKPPHRTVLIRLYRLYLKRTSQIALHSIKDNTINIAPVLSTFQLKPDQDALLLNLWDTECIPALHPVFRNFGIQHHLSPVMSNISLAVSACRASRLLPQKKPATAPSELRSLYKGKLGHSLFVTGYLGIPIFLVLIFGYKIIYKTKGYKPVEVDLFSGKDIIDREEEEFLARKAASKAAQANEVKSKGRWFYRHFIAWLL